MAQFSINEITKNNPNRWFYVMNSQGETGLVVFGYAGDQGVTEVVTGQPTINAFLTEDELESFVNEDVGIDEYYKNSVESGSDKFQGPSDKYIPNPPE
jgi:hypothetical protein